MIHGARPNSTISAERFFYPPHLSNITINFPGRDGFNITTGLQNTGINIGRNSYSLIYYHGWLVKNGMYKDSFDTFMPPYRPIERLHLTDRPREALGYDSVYVVDMGKIVMLKDEHITVRLSYNELSRPRWYLRVMAISQLLHTYTAEKKWQKDFVVVK